MYLYYLISIVSSKSLEFKYSAEMWELGIITSLTMSFLFLCAVDNANFRRDFISTSSVPSDPRFHLCYMQSSAFRLVVPEFQIYQLTSPSRWVEWLLVKSGISNSVYGTVTHKKKPLNHFIQPVWIVVLGASLCLVPQSLSCTKPSFLCHYTNEVSFSFHYTFTQHLC